MGWEKQFPGRLLGSAEIPGAPPGAAGMDPHPTAKESCRHPAACVSLHPTEGQARKAAAGGFARPKQGIKTERCQFGSDPTHSVQARGDHHPGDGVGCTRLPRAPHRGTCGHTPARVLARPSAGGSVPAPSPALTGASRVLLPVPGCPLSPCQGHPHPHAYMPG